MTDKVQIVSIPEEKTTASDQAALLKDVIVQIRNDSVKASREYLEETTVPHGGE